ncbi:hypothetical protein MJH12_05355 [bacterium]|nr:hypothetical protein [bacterium]
MIKQILTALLFIVIGAGATIFYLKSQASHSKQHDHGAVICPEHKIAEKACPWCDKTLIKKMGICPEHKVAEALCSRCNKALIPGFIAEDDWCAGHNIPESQCDLCKAGILPEDELKKGK